MAESQGEDRLNLYGRLSQVVCCSGPRVTTSRRYWPMHLCRCACNAYIYRCGVRFRDRAIRASPSGNWSGQQAGRFCRTLQAVTRQVRR